MNSSLLSLSFPTRASPPLKAPGRSLRGPGVFRPGSLGLPLSFAALELLSTIHDLQGIPSPPGLTVSGSNDNPAVWAPQRRAGALTDSGKGGVERPQRGRPAARGWRRPPLRDGKPAQERELIHRKGVWRRPSPGRSAVRPPDRSLARPRPAGLRRDAVQSSAVS